MEALWKSKVLSLMEVEGPRLIRGNDRFNKTYLCVGEDSEANWVSLLGFSDRAEPLAWLKRVDSAQHAFVGRIVRNEGNDSGWLRLRRFGDLVQSPEGVELIEVEDVTDERENFERIRMEGQHFHALIERSSEGISLFDTEANILYESPSNKRIHGYESWEMEGKNLFDFCHEDDLARALPRFEQLAKGPGAVETEVVRFKHKEGHWIYLEGTVINATNDPRVGALVNNFRDVTARLEAEREVRRAKDAAEEAQRLQQHFLTNLSHEFKTPLTLIRGPLMDLTEGRISHEQLPEVLPRVLRNLDRLNGLISELVDLSRLDAGSFSMQVNRHDLVEFIRGEVDAFSVLAESKQVTVCIEAPSTCSVFIDVSKMDKVVNNLLSNALRYSPESGEVRVRVHVQEDAEDGIVRVEVIDQGEGMSEDVRIRVFERFYQADTKLTRSHEGMGVGLALAREMIEMHGGDIGVDSQPGAGSTFWFTLPLGCAHLDPDDIDTGAVREPRPHTVGGSAATAPHVGMVERAFYRPRLLLIEDNVDMRAYLKMNLDPYYQISEASDGRSVLEVVESSNPEIILSDVMMPHVDGLTLCRELKASSRWRSIPLFLLSAKGSVDHRVEGLAAGADDYMAKPFSVAELLQRLHSRVPWQMEATELETAWEEKLELSIQHGLSQSNYDVKQLSKELGYSERQLLRRVMNAYGMKPSALILQRRLEQAHEYLNQKRYETVAELAHSVGLSPGYFSRRYRNHYNLNAVIRA